MDDKYIALLTKLFEEKFKAMDKRDATFKKDVIQPLVTEVKSQSKRITTLENWKWKVVGIIMGSGGAGFLTGATFDKLFKGE